MVASRTATGGPARTTRKERAAETEAALKEAARRVFARKGYLNCKIVDITEEAGRAAGSFYNHFAGKEQLLEALAKDMLEGAGEGFAEPHAHHDLSDLDVLRDHVAVFWHTYRTHLPEIVAMTQASMTDAHLAERLRQMRMAHMGPIRDHLETMCEDGLTLPGAAPVVASAMVSMLEQFCYVWLVTGGEELGRPLSDDEAIDTLTRFMHGGIARSS
ncbi:TetR/AcrR family transcriptional regulator [Streptomyces sp. NBC_00893]|uniref:TetR/AcrR family transcriptional regulator n=1 Tax=Streptomyces sp. NBC_00893 TaxID=2975862 RepID=UPI00224EA2B0|nr:TetR/AcrR family transcriptional regulator [Streptomyces sp. NBC_00893]MCX4851542.1 TetR/AcrR family transcriptional regulator [Streptomyces sp. NBC_00893]